MAAPKLRFKEFDGDWSSVSLLEISTLITKGTTPKQFIEGNINFLKIEAITQNGFDLSKCQTISDEINNNELKRSVLMEGDILFAIAGATIGKNAIVQKELLPANTNQALAIIRLKENYSKIFISKVLNSPLMEKYIDINISTGAQPNLNLQQIGSFSFALPKLEEQTKIASFLSSVDEKISQLTQKHELLSQYKQGMMQKMFTQQLRFKADDGSEFGEWEEVALSKVSDVRDGTHDSPSYVKDGYPLITSKNLKNGKLDLTDINLISEDDYLNINKRSAVNIGDIIFGMIGTIGNPVLLNSDGFAIKNVALIKEKDELLNIYLIHYLNSSFFAKQVALLNAGNTQKFLALGQIRSLSIHKPQLAEQTKIANFLSSIDQKIEVVAQQIEQAKQWKKGLLQQMFV